MTRFPLHAAVFVLLSACAGAAPAPDPLASAACNGKRFIEVRNTLDKAIDVYEGDRLKPTEAKLIGRALPGDSRLAVAHSVLHIFALDENGRGLTMDPTASSIRYQNVCIP
ncbi:MAG: hypothetical protein ABIY52_10975 [Gemmatimonadaceae bacterium]